MIVWFLSSLWSSSRPTSLGCMVFQTVANVWLHIVWQSQCKFGIDILWGVSSCGCFTSARHLEFHSKGKSFFSQPSSKSFASMLPRQSTSVIIAVDSLPSLSICHAFAIFKGLLILFHHLLVFPCCDPLSQQSCVLVYDNQMKAIMIYNTALPSSSERPRFVAV